MDVSDLWKLGLLATCLILSTFFSASETAFIALPRVRLMHLANIGTPGAARVSRMVEQPDKLLATVLLGNNLVNTLAAVLATALAINLMDNTDLAVLVATASITLFLLVFGETLPKTLAWSRAETVAFTLARPLALVGWVLSPVSRLLQGVSLLVSRVFGITSVRSHVTEEEIRTMISVGAQAGVVEPNEAEMLEKVFRFGDRQVREIMTPRTEIAWVEKNSPMQEFLRTYSQQTYTRFPVYENDMENIVGILSVKDVLQVMREGGLEPGRSVTDTLRPAYFVPETKLVGQLFSELRQEGQQMAIVTDEFGGVAGMVTLKSLLEVIVGPVGEEGEPAHEDFSSLGDNVYDVDAGMGIEDVNEELALGIPQGNYQTIAGFILERMGHIPREGEFIYYNDLRLEVTEARPRKIERVQIQRASYPEDGSQP